MHVSLEQDLPSRRHGKANDYELSINVIPARQPRPMNPSEPSLTHLNNDMAMAIMDLLQAESPRTLNNFALVSSYYYRLARLAQHREIVIILVDPGVAERQIESIERNELLPAVRRIRLKDLDDRSVEEEREKYRMTTSMICDLLPKLTGLTDLETQMIAGVPKEILRAVHRMPTVRLHSVPTEPAYSDASIQEELAVLQGMSNLRSLSVIHVYNTLQSCRPVTAALKRVLLSCPNIRSLKLDIGLPTSGCSRPRVSREYHGLGFTNGERPPALEELDLERYPWGRRPDEQWAGSPWAQLGYPNEGEEEDYWADVFDWTKLRRLKLPNSNLALKFMPHLTAIQEVDFENDYVHLDRERAGEANIKTFLEQVPAQLESITVPTMASLTLDGLLRHGETLRKLKVHQKESRVDWRGAAVTGEFLIQLRDRCPHLEVLALDVARQGDWPWSTLDILASFPRLHTITLYFELGRVNDETPVQPYVTFAAAHHLCTYLYWRNPRIRRLDLVSGFPAPRGFGHPSPMAWWASCNSTAFECKISERDDEAARGVYEVRCPKLEEAYRSKSPWSAEEEKEKVAYLGPTQPAQWH